MRDQSASEENRSAALTPAPRSRAPRRVTDASPREGFTLFVRFADGSEGMVDLTVLVRAANAGIFADLKDEALFRAVCVEGGVVTWPNGVDLAPDAMYRAIRATGLFRPGTGQAA